MFSFALRHPFPEMFSMFTPTKTTIVPSSHWWAKMHRAV
jgi:hypothetical protein